MTITTIGDPVLPETLLNVGCPSVPGLRGDVECHTRLLVHYFDRDGGFGRQHQAFLERIRPYT